MFRCLLQLKDIDIAKYKFRRFWYPRHCRYRHPTSSFHARWSVAVPHRRITSTSSNPLATLTENWCYFPEAKLGGVSLRRLRWWWWWSGRYFRSTWCHNRNGNWNICDRICSRRVNRQSCTSAVFDNLIWFTFIRMWRGNKLLYMSEGLLFNVLIRQKAETVDNLKKRFAYRHSFKAKKACGFQFFDIWYLESLACAFSP